MISALFLCNDTRQPMLSDKTRTVSQNVTQAGDQMADRRTARLPINIQDLDRRRSHSACSQHAKNAKQVPLASRHSSETLTSARQCPHPINPVPRLDVKPKQHATYASIESHRQSTTSRASHTYHMSQMIVPSTARPSPSDPPLPWTMDPCMDGQPCFCCCAVTGLQQTRLWPALCARPQAAAVHVPKV